MDKITYLSFQYKIVHSWLIGVNLVSQVAKDMLMVFKVWKLFLNNSWDHLYLFYIYIYIYIFYWTCEFAIFSLLIPTFFSSFDSLIYQHHHLAPLLSALPLVTLVIRPTLSHHTPSRMMWCVDNIFLLNFGIHCQLTWTWLTSKFFT